MRFERIYLITWIQRSTIHLEEVFDFLKGRFERLPLLESEKLSLLRKGLDIQSVALTERNDFETIDAKLQELTFTMTEDGVFILSSPVNQIKENQSRLEAYYREKLGPTLMYLFSRGAPLPKALAEIKEIHPFVLVVKDAEDKEIDDLYRDLGETWDKEASSRTTQFFFGPALTVMRKVRKDPRRDASLEEILANVIFLREFYKQLRKYLNLHRGMWDQISAIRESTNLRYKDFPEIRRTIMDFLKTLFFVKARLAQMQDIAKARGELLRPTLRAELKECALYRFDNAVADQRYVADIWQMTIEYVQGTLQMLESLFQENTQRELNALKFITLVAALTGFFGMNIAFPWEGRWPTAFGSSIAVVGILALTAIGFYFLLRRFIYNRHFTVQK